MAFFDLSLAPLDLTPTRMVYSAATLTVADRVVIGDTSVGAYAVTLPDATTCPGLVLWIKKVVGSGGAPVLNPLTITPFGSQTIDRAASEQISMSGGFRQLVSDGSNWWIIGGKIDPVIQQLTTIATGNIAMDASAATVFRITVSGATCTIQPPTNPIDADTVQLEILVTNAAGCTITFGTGTAPATILLTGAVTPTMTAPQNKRVFVTMRFIATVGWFALGAASQA
jgi:hypothetical protein